MVPLLSKNQDNRSTSTNLQLDRTSRRSHIRIVVLVDARLEGAGADGILGAQAEVKSDGLPR